MGSAILMAAAILLAICGVLSALFLSKVASSHSGRMFQALMWVIALASGAGVILSGRALRFGDTGLQVEVGADVGAALSAKILLALGIGMSVALCIAYATKAWWARLPADRFKIRGLYAPNDITLALLVFYVAFSLVPLAFAPDHYFHVSLVYPLFIFWALMLWLRHSTVDPVLVIKQTLALLVIGSLVAAIALPALALQPGYTGLIPGFNQRLWGITASANTIGACALGLLVIEISEPAQRRWMHWVLLVCAVVALILSQSKAAVIAAMTCVTLLAGWRWVIAKNASPGRGAGHGVLVAMVGLCLDRKSVV